MRRTSWMHLLAKTLASAGFIWRSAGSSINPVLASRSGARVVRNSSRPSTKSAVGPWQKATAPQSTPFFAKIFLIQSARTSWLPRRGKSAAKELLLEGDASVVERYVQLAILLNRLVHEGSNVAFIAYISSDVGGCSAAGSAFVLDFLSNCLRLNRWVQFPRQRTGRTLPSVPLTGKESGQISPSWQAYLTPKRQLTRIASKLGASDWQAEQGINMRLQSRQVPINSVQMEIFFDPSHEAMHLG